MGGATYALVMPTPMVKGWGNDGKARRSACCGTPPVSILFRFLAVGALLSLFFLLSLLALYIP